VVGITILKGSDGVEGEIGNEVDLGMGKAGIDSGGVVVAVVELQLAGR
jgi:hypothetical protein